MTDSQTFTAFQGHRRLASGALETVAQAIAAVGDASPLPLVFDDVTGQPVELDLRGGPERAAAEYRARHATPETQPVRQGRGRPRLGVVAREVTLLPRHWDWLATQPGGASAALRRLVEEARRANPDGDPAREAQAVVYRVMSALAGDLPGFEEASRALFAGQRERLLGIVAGWPADVADHVHRLASRP